MSQFQHEDDESLKGSGIRTCSSSIIYLKMQRRKLLQKSSKVLRANLPSVPPFYCMSVPLASCVSVCLSSYFLDATYLHSPVVLLRVFPNVRHRLPCLMLWLSVCLSASISCFPILPSVFNECAKSYVSPVVLLLKLGFIRHWLGSRTCEVITHITYMQIWR